MTKRKPQPPAPKPPKSEVLAEDALKKWPNETEQQHRGFLLWLMLGEGTVNRHSRRTPYAVAKTFGMTAEGCRRWSIRFEWDKRLARIGKDADVRAQEAYKELYYFTSGGPHEIEPVRERMFTPFVPPDADFAEKHCQQVIEQATPPVKRGPKELDIDIPATADTADALRKKLKLLCDATISRFAQGLQSNRVKVGVGEFKVILDVLKTLSEVPTSAQMRDPLATSVRVEEAVKKGEDWVAAIREDIAEMDLIAAALAEHENASNVIPFPGGKQVPKAVAG